MFEFFEGMVEKLGVKLVTDFSSKLVEFISKSKKGKELGWV